MYATAITGRKCARGKASCVGVTPIVWGPEAIFGVNLALASIQCFIVVPIAPESPDSKSARCQAVTLGEIELP